MNLDIATIADIMTIAVPLVGLSYWILKHFVSFRPVVGNVTNIYYAPVTNFNIAAPAPKEVIDDSAKRQRKAILERVERQRANLKGTSQSTIEVTKQREFLGCLMTLEAVMLSGSVSDAVARMMVRNIACIKIQALKEKKDMAVLGDAVEKLMSLRNMEDYYKVSSAVEPLLRVVTLWSNNERKE